ncbi:hypothetical protein CG716_20205 [Mycolicibacterium sphagni]|uniref:Uncharacterized protein n=2 Tax=Mycolicibacterium sphagni TaxID=1786 RepID=A0A255DBJ7_9MYCO|nr:hypothetical protein CG716_20205 [Mycolicibacterium sphagni]
MVAPGKPRWRWRWRHRWFVPAFVTLAGREFYFPALISVWHVEPHGVDALQGECKGTRWRWHIHHWRIQWNVLQRWRRRLLTRCAWCGGRDTKSDPVNCSVNGILRPRVKTRWWQSESAIAHGDCSSVEHAHRLCLCENPGLSHGDYGQCAFCGKFRAWRHVPTIPDRYLASLPEGSRIPAGKQEWLKVEWAKVRAEREAASEGDTHV